MSLSRRWDCNILDGESLAQVMVAVIDAQKAWNNKSQTEVMTLVCMVLTVRWKKCKTHLATFPFFMLAVFLSHNTMVSARNKLMISSSKF
jgi:hypothetical protein